MCRYAVTMLLVLSLTAWTGCTREVELPAPDPVAVETSIGDVSDGGTRTSMSGSTASFASGDNIGLFETLTGQSNVSYIFNGTSWNASAPAYWRDATSSHTFYAYYPYNASYSGTKVAVPVLAAQATGTTPSAASDLLVAGPRTQTRSSGVPLTFTHAYALIQLNIKMGILGLVSPYILNSITINGGNATGSSNFYGIANTTGTPTQVGYNLTTGALQSDVNTSARFTQSFTVNVTGVSLLTTAVTLYLFVLPGTYAAPVPSISFKLSLLGSPAPSSTENFGNTTFLAGRKYVYDVSIARLFRTPQETAAPLVAREIVPIDQQPFNIE